MLTLVVSIVALAMLLAGCGPPRPSLSVATPTIPDATGCYVLVFDEAQFMGTQEFLNGPAAYPTLAHLPAGRSWLRRIRSVKMGPAADMTAWVQEDFQGAVIEFGYDKAYGRLTPSFNGKIASAEITCHHAPATP